MRKPNVTDLVMVVVDKRTNNGHPYAPAIVTSVKESEEEGVRVNLRVFLDTGADRKYNNIEILDSEPKHKQGDHEFPVKAAFWPKS